MEVSYKEGTWSICPIPSRPPFQLFGCAIITFENQIMLSPSRLISLLSMIVSSIADSTLSLQADKSSSSLASGGYEPPNFPLINISNGADLEIPVSNVELQQLEQSKSSHGCFSYSNIDTNRSNRKLRLRREDATCGWNDQSRGHVIPSRTNSLVPLAIGTYIAGGSLSDKWSVCGSDLSVVVNFIPVCTPTNLADITGDDMTSLREGPYTDLLMARLCTVTFRLLQSETRSTEPFCQHLWKS